MDAEVRHDWEAMDALLDEEVMRWRLIPKRNLEGHYKMMMMNGTITTLIFRQLSLKTSYMYQAHIF